MGRSFRFDLGQSRRQAVTLVLALAGALAGIAVQLPLPWLLGPMFACLLVSLGGASLSGPGPLVPLLRTVLGLAIGASFTPALLDRLGEMAVSLSLLPVYVACIGAIGYPFFRRVCGFDRPTAFYSAMPGGLPDMTALGAEAGGDVRILSLIHATRVLVIVSLLPFWVDWAYELELRGARAPGDPLTDFGAGELLLMAALALGGWLLAVRLKLSGASMLGPMLVAAVASMTGLIERRPPAEAIILAQLVIGASVGVRYVNVSRRLLIRAVSAGLGYCAALLLIGLGFTTIDLLTGVPPIDAMLAFAPGGQAEMTVLALAIGADVAFVALHHVARVFIVMLGAPLAHRFLR